MKKTVWLFLILCLVHSVPFAAAMCVKTAKANTRSGPGVQYETIWEAYKYMPFEKVGVSVSGKWYAVRDVDGDVSWIHKNLVTNAFRCAVVKKSRVNVRKGPGTRYRKTRLGFARQYYSFRVMKRSGAWVKTRDESGEVGWIHKDFLWIK
jgi:SH3-like domain-containing protein